MDMSYSWGTFVIGLIIMLAGAIVTLFHRQIADFLGGGAVDYDRFKLAGVIACGVGLLVMLNLVSLILKFVLGGLFKPLGS